jgi:PAS domain S-box-containing protein
MKNLLTGITKANHFLLKEKNFEKALELLVSSLGLNTDVDRCYIFQNKIEEGVVKLYYNYEWCNEGVNPEIENPLLSDITYESFPGLYDSFILDKPFNEIVSKIENNDALKYILESQEIKSILIVPILVNDFFWGWIGLDDCKVEKLWLDEQVFAIHSVAKNIGLRLSQEITNKKLEDTLETFDFYMKGSGQAMWELNLEDQTVFFSYNWMGMLGFKPFEFEHTYENWKKLVHPEDFKKIEIDLNNYIEGKINIYEGIGRLKHKKGHYVWVKYGGLIKKNTDNKPIKIIGTHIDVSELKEKEITIERKSNELNQIIDNINEAVFKLDKKFTFTFLSPYWKTITGFESSSALKDSILSYIDKNYQQELTKLLKNIVLHINETFEVELVIKDKNNQKKWVSIRAKSYLEKNTVLIVGRLLDINDKKVAEESLKISEVKYRFIAENTTDLISLFDTNLQFDYLSNSSKSIIGFEPSELKGHYFRDYLHQEDKKKFDIIFQKSFRKKKPFTFTFRFRKKNNDYLWLETSSTFLFDEKSNIIGVQSSSRNVSERVKIKQELESALQKEKYLNSLKSSFVSTVSHQFRTPLTVIFSNMELIELSIRNLLDKTIQNRLTIVANRIKSEVNRMTEMMDNILIFGKYEAGKISIKQKPTFINDFLKKIKQTYFINQPDGRTFQINYKGSPKLIYVDDQLLTHVITNILSNAFKYSLGKESPEVHVNYGIKFTSIKIIDYGIGIPKEDMDKLYNSFFRARNTETFEGYGLGLVIAKQFTEIQGGTITIESELNLGTKVILKFPNYEN